MKFSLDDVATDTKKVVSALDVSTAVKIFERVRGKLIDLEAADFIEILQCRFSAEAKSGPLTMHFKCILAHPCLTSEFRYSLEDSMRVDWQDGGITAGTARLVGKITNRLSMISDELSDVAKSLKFKD